MRRKPEMTVWAAVIAGVNYCQESDAPAANLRQFLEKLQVQHWHPADTSVIEQCVLELLNWKREQIPRQLASATQWPASDQGSRPLEVAEEADATKKRVRWHSRPLTRPSRFLSNSQPGHNQ